MNPEVTLMNPAEPNAFARFYALTPAERVAAAVRLIRTLKRSRRRVMGQFVRSQARDVQWGCWGGATADIENAALSLTRLIRWMESRYGLGSECSPAVVARVRRDFEYVQPENRSSVPRRRQMQR